MRHIALKKDRINGVQLQRFFLREKAISSLCNKKDLALR
jgi:hypothetical protein